LTIKVIYVIGASYSGSTVMGAILGSHPNIVDAGEMFTHGGRPIDDSKAKCSCGETLDSCPFWTQVWREWCLRLPGVDRQTYQRRMSRYQRFRSLPRLWLKQAFPSDDYRRFQREALEILECVTLKAERAVVVDVSKSPPRALALAAVPDIDLRLIHLIRNGLANIPSTIKHKGSRWARQGRTEQQLMAASSNSWLVANLGAEFVIRATRRPSARIRYEDLITSPREAISSLSRTVGEDLSDVAERVASGQPIDFGHAGGNIAGRQGPRPLWRNDKWADALPAAAERIFSVRAGWLNRRYGYAARPRTNEL
jgi:hypothetical protein